MSQELRPADPETVARRVAERLGVTDERPVRSLLSAWWTWAGAVSARGDVVDSGAFLDQREAEGLLELDRPLAERAIEIELAHLHALGRARRAGPARERRTLRATAERSPTLVGVAAMVLLAVLVAASIALGAAIPHVPLPGGGPHAATEPYRAWLGVVAGVTGLVAALIGGSRRPAARAALLVPALGLAALALFGLGLLGSAAWLEWTAGTLFLVAGVGAWLAARR